MNLPRVIARLAAMEPRTTRAVTDLARPRVVGPDAPDAVSTLLEEHARGGGAYFEQSAGHARKRCCRLLSSAPGVPSVHVREHGGGVRRCGARRRTCRRRRRWKAPLAADLAALVVALRGSALLVGPNEYEPKRGAKGFANLVNGDRMPHALGLGVQQLLGRKVARTRSTSRSAARAAPRAHRRALARGAEREPGAQVVGDRHARAQRRHLRRRARSVRRGGRRRRRAAHAVARRRDDLYCGLPELICSPSASAASASTPAPRVASGRRQAPGGDARARADGGAAVGRRAAAARRPDLQLTGQLLGVGAPALGRQPARRRAQAGRGGAGRQPKAKSREVSRNLSL